MRRALLALVVLALLPVAVSGTWSSFTKTVSNTGTAQTHATFTPINLTPPQISGAVVNLGTVTVATPGTWRSNLALGTPTYTWKACTGLTDSTCATIPAATGTSLSITLTILGLGTHIEAVESISNSFGASTALSNID